MIDVLVAGGGPAGLATAINAAQAGLSVVVVEPRQTPVDKACGEGLLPGGVLALQRLGVAVDGHPLRGIRYLDPRHEVDAYFRAGPGLGIRRTALHAALRRRADEVGVEVIAGSVDRVERQPDGLLAAGLQARWLVGADGLHSGIRRLVSPEPQGHEVQRHKIRRYGLRAHFPVEPWTDLVEVHWTGDCEAYVTPVGERLVGVALLGAPGPQRASFAERLSGFPALTRRLTQPPVTPVRGAGPMWRPVRRRVSGRVLLVGDAAGYTDALTGEGLALAMRSAEMLVQRLAENRPDRYETDWRRLSRRHRLLTGTLLGIRRNALTAGAIVPAAAALPAVFAAIVHSLE
jgi:flavin-dependent dehydrogenase